MLPRRLVILASGLCAAVAAGATALVVATLVFAACTDDASSEPAVPDADGLVSSLGESVCPDAAPAPGEGCVLPEGTTCAFGACGSPIASCVVGAWRYGGNPAARPPCPKDFPASDSPCPACWPSGASCTYGSSDCSQPDASTNTTIASCPGGRWFLATFPCSTDAGADVQGDAEPDAD